MSGFLARLKIAFDYDRAEIEKHPHVEEERGELYSSLDGCSTELETLNFLNAVVRLWKPKTLLETGTYLGFGTLALIDAIKANGFGKLITIEVNETYKQLAKKHLHIFDTDLDTSVQFICQDSVEFLEKHDYKYDFVFIDTELETRIKEIKTLFSRRLLNKNAVIAVHDTSRFRKDTYTSNVRLRHYLRRYTTCVEMPYSRGLTLITCTENNYEV